jgi:Mrp family chromosome partitioning ATPase
MERIKQAIELAKASATPDRVRPTTAVPGLVAEMPMVSAKSSTSGRTPDQSALSQHFKEANLDHSHLEQHRIVAHNAADQRSRAFDMLRTQVLQAMDQKNWQFLAVTSPTAGCGKTVTAINLALSIARQPERSALLIDMDLQRPTVAEYLGIKCQKGLLGVLEGRTTPADSIIRARVDGSELLVLPAEAPTVRSSELVASRTMNTMLQDFRQTFVSRTVIFDMPPLLSGDEVIAMLPRIDCVLLVTATGISTLSQVTQCNRHLQSAEVVRLVLNKAHEPNNHYYY